VRPPAVRYLVMKAVIAHVSEEELARRRLTGIDRFDEMWEGVLHMAPAPTYEHQRIVGDLLIFLGPLCLKHARGVLTHQLNVFNEASAEPDYRIPDLTFVAAGREHILAPDGTRGGGPDAVIEVRSPYDETYEKLPFFARLGVREVIVIDRDTKQPEIYRLAGAHYVVVQPDAARWVNSAALKVRFTRTDADRLQIEDLDDPATRTEI
jgi:Uma2 family endonuclease